MKEMKNKTLIEKYVKSLEWLRDDFSEMDDMINPIMGIRDWDDSCVLEFFGKIVASTDGPYAKRLVMKSALIHAATDVVVKGAKPLFALDTLIGTESEIKEMAHSLKTQAIAMKIPILMPDLVLEKLWECIYLYNILCCVLSMIAEVRVLRLSLCVCLSVK